MATSLGFSSPVVSLCGAPTHPPLPLWAVVIFTERCTAQGAEGPPHAVITWIGGPTSEENRRNKGSGTWHCKGELRGSLLEKGGGQLLDPLVGRAHQSAEQWERPSTFPLGEKLPSDFPRSVQGATRAESRPSCWLHPSINMRGVGLLIETSTRCSHSSLVKL